MSMYLRVYFRPSSGHTQDGRLFEAEWPNVMLSNGL
jgi:hypothetical protein